MMSTVQAPGVNGGRFNGLDEDEVQRRRREYGENVLPSGKKVSPLAILLSQVKSPLVYVILAAALVSLFMGETMDFFIIMAVVVFDVILGFIQEYQANRTYESLKGLVKPVATVIRGGLRKQVEVKELVPGDVVLVDSGERVPADGTLEEAYALSVNESILTGESEAVTKRAQDPIYMGTIVLTGRGVMTVTATGARTELGKIASTLAETPEQETPLQRRLEGFSRTLTRIVIGVTVLLFLIGVATGRPALEMVRVAIILAIAAIPEGLLIAVTMILVIGMKNILRRKGLVKKLLAVETLGSVTTVCTDKTGTLTEGQMKVTRWDLTEPDMAKLVLVLDNNLSDSLEASLWEFAGKHWGEDPQEIAGKYPRLDEVPFSSETKYMKTVHLVNGNRISLVKGAPEVVLAMCDVDLREQQRLRAQWDAWASEGLKLLGLAYKLEAGFDDKAPASSCEERSASADGNLRPNSGGVECSTGAANANAVEDMSGYTWAGLVGLEDPVRSEVPAAVEVCRKAGIKVKIITGDHKGTALKVASFIGLDAGEDSVLEGSDLDAMDDATLEQRVVDTVVFSRIAPHQKLRIVQALQSRGEVVAMVGDGVNDAPALKKADIGVVVGNATDVAKETSDLILLDSNFKTIVDAIEEGRVIFQNIRKVVSYTLSNSFAEILLMFVAMILGWPAPLVVAQILWVHLICDGPVDIALGFEPKEEGIMEEKPRPVSEPFLDRLGMSLIAAISVSAAAGCLYMFGHYWRVHGDLLLARTFAFETLAVISLVYVFAYRSMRRSLFQTGHLTANKPLLVFVSLGFILALVPVLVPRLRTVLGVVPLTAGQWALVFGIGLGLLMIVETGKWLKLRQNKEERAEAR
ncbi:MAG: HAD-IC family P-type ATPase [Firmicutes bacterium]|nr:HAD-IC family P-type ATPase [Candidatus Fermentithermobacillaceae bacterium]